MKIPIGISEDYGAVIHPKVENKVVGIYSLGGSRYLSNDGQSENFKKKTMNKYSMLEIIFITLDSDISILYLVCRCRGELPGMFNNNIGSTS